MKRIVKILLLLLICITAKSQAPQPSGFPAPYSTGYYRIGWIQADSGTIPAYRDTFFIPRFQGTEILWLHTGVDTSKWIRIGSRWIKELKAGDNAIALTTNGSSGPSTLLNGVLNIPVYGGGSGGITSLNGLTTATQTFAVGSTGADFNIFSSGSIHTFNIPTGGASVRGLISTTDWSAFNAKQAQLNGTGFVKVTGTTVSYDNSSYYLSSNPSAFIPLTAISALAPVLYNNSTGVISADTSAGLTHFATQAYVLAHQSSGTISGAGNLVPLFTTNIVSNTLVFTLTDAAARSVLGNNTGSTGPPAYYVPNAATLNNWFEGNIQGAITLTTTGSSGAATLIGNTLNVPQYSGAQSFQNTLSVSGILNINNTITNTGQILNITGGQFRLNGLLTAPGTPTFLMHGSDSTTYQLTAAQAAALFPVNNIYVKRGLSNSNDSTFVWGNATILDSNVVINQGLVRQIKWDSVGSGMVFNKVPIGFGTVSLLGRNADSSLMQLTLGANLSIVAGALTASGGGSQTFPQVLATGRTFSLNDSVLLGTTTLKFKETGGSGTGTFGKVLFYNSTNTSAEPKTLNDFVAGFIGPRVLIGDSTLNEPGMLEWTAFPSWGGHTRFGVGPLGSPELNMWWNMNYRGAVHHYYDSLYDALWSFLGSNGQGLQTVGKGHSNQVDIYNNFGQIVYRFDWLKSGNDYIGSVLSTNGIKIYEQASMNRDMTTGNFANFSASAASGGMYTFGNIKNRFYWTGTGVNGSSTEQYFEAKRAGGTPFLLTAGDSMWTVNSNTVGLIRLVASSDAPGNFTSPDFQIKLQNAAGTMTNRFSVLHTGFVGINTITPAHSLDIVGTDAVLLPGGTTAQRSANLAGLIRYNSDSTKLEFNTGSGWVTLSAAGGGITSWQQLLGISPALTGNVSQDMATFSITWYKGTALGVSNSYGNYNYYGPPNQGIKIFDSTSNNLNHADWIVNGTGSTFQGTMTQYRFASPLITSDPQSTDPANYGFNAGKSRFAIPTANALTDPWVIFGSNTTGSMMAVFNLVTDSRTYAFRINNNGNVAMGLTTATAELHIGAGTATAGRGPLKFTSGTPTTTPEAGLINYNNGLLMLDSSTSVRDTLSTRSWVRNNFSSGGGGSNMANADLTMSASHTVDGSASNFSWTLGSALGNRITAFSVNSLNLINLSTSTGYVALDGALKLKYILATDANLDLSTIYGINIQLPTITANRTITLPSPTSNVQTFTLFNTNSTAFTWTFASTILDLSGNTVTSIPANSSMVIYANSTSWYVLSTSSASGGKIKYQHTIFTPTTGGTVSLNNNQYNIINPAGTLLAVTLNLPSSPQNNDVVYIKFTQTVSTVTYANGTVVDGITAPSAGGLVVLTYDAGTTSWY